MKVDERPRHEQLEAVAGGLASNFFSYLGGYDDYEFSWGEKEAIEEQAHAQVIQALVNRQEIE